MGTNLTLKEKVGQLMMFGFKERAIPTHIEEFIRQHNLGGIIHFSRNITNPQQIKALNAKLQDLAKQNPNGTDLFIALDQEGGSVMRLTNGVSVSPGNMAIGATANPLLAEKSAVIMGEELRALGFNVNLAPCIDINNNAENPVIGIRSYGSSPELVGDLGEASIRGFQKHLLAVAKHFPGHGDTHVDSHLSMPVIEHNWEKLSEFELVPFKKAIMGGVGGILAAHILFPALESDPNFPATLSPRILTKLLREQLGFQGLIFTDCMEMEAITKHYNVGDAAVLSIVAGSDIILVSHTPEKQNEVYWAVIEAVRQGRISVERLDQSLERIRLAKKRLASLADQQRTVGGVAHLEVMDEIVKKSLTVVHDKGNIPLRHKKLLVIETVAQATSIAEEKITESKTLAHALIAAGFQVDAETIGLTCTAEQRKRLVDLATNRQLVIIVSQDAHRYKGQSELIQEVTKAAHEVIVIGARTPYELIYFPEVSTYVSTYSNRSLVWDSVVELLTGKIKAQGKLPVFLV